MKLQKFQVLILSAPFWMGALWLQSCGGNSPTSASSVTKTPTVTGTPTNTPTVTSTATVTSTPTVTATATACTSTISQATGSANFGIGGNSYAAPFTAPADGNAWQVVLRDIQTVSGAGNIRVGIYSDNSGPNQLLGASDYVVAPGSAAPVTFALPSVQLTQGQAYWLAFGIPTDGSNIGFPDSTNDGTNSVRAVYSQDLPTSGTWVASNVLVGYSITYCP